MSSLSGLVGHQKVKEVFSRMLSHDQLPHALLFIGPEHVGKTTLAHSLIQPLFETDKSIQVIPDVTTLERLSDPKTEKLKTNISVEQIREFIERLSMSPMLGSWKVGFIEESSRLSNAAANALLKTLEEPKGKTLIILRATSLKDLPATIVSRCQIIRLYPVSVSVIEQALIKRGLTAVDAQELAKRSYGRPGIAFSSIAHAQQQSESDFRLNTFLELLSSPLAQQFGAVTNLVSKEEQNKTDELIDLLDQWEPILRDVLLMQQGCLELCLHDKQRDKIERLAKQCSPVVV